MMKRLLFSVFAVAMSLGAFATEENQYVYTSTQRFQATGANMLVNGDFASNNFDSWTQDDGTAVDAEAWEIGQAEGPDGKNSAKRLAAGSLVQTVTLQNSGGYVVSMWIKGEAIGTTSAITAFVNTDASLIAGTNSIETPVVTFLSSTTYTTEWKQVAAYVNVDDSIFTKDGIPTLVVSLNGMPEGTQVADFSVNTVNEVYDIRIMQNRLAFAKEVMAMPEFNVEAAAEQLATLQGTVEGIEAMIEGNMMDDASTAEGAITSFEEILEAFLSVTSVSASSQIPGLNISELATFGRAGIGSRASTYKLNLSGNWGHLASEIDVLRSAIQNGYAHSATYNAYHEDFPKGKYFFTCEIRNANTGKTSWPTEPVFNLTTEGCKMFIGTDTIELDPIFGEDFQRFSMVGEVKEDGKFYVGVYWPGVTSGGAFFIRNTMVRSFDQELNTTVEHIQAWKKYKTQWDAAVSARLGVLTKIADENYPWRKDSLNQALTNWDPYYNAQDAKHWITAEGEDAGVATTDELSDWALYQGVEAYSEPTEEGAEPTRLTYQLVRGYQNAINFSIAQNKPFTDLAEAIDAAKKVRNQGANLTGDRDAFKTAIEAAIATIKSVRAATTDATMEADAQTLATALETLKAAQEAFLASVTNAPVVDIDFSNPFVEENDDDYPTFGYSVSGTAGKIWFTTVEPDNTTGSNSWQKGYNGELEDVARVGNTGAVAFLPRELADDEELTVQFDVWLGNLSGKNFYVDLRNSDDQRVAGFSINRYNGSVAYNEFNDVLTNGGTGMNILKYASGVGSSAESNVAICADANKSSITLVIDYAGKTVKGTIVNGKNGTCEGAALSLPTPENGDNKVAKFVVGSNYGTDARRCWFDNLKISISSSAANIEEDITESGWAPEPVVDGIEAVATEKKVVNNAVYNLNGQRVQNPTKGLYIINGRKVVIK